MKKTLLAITSVITAMGATTSIYLATVDNPTEIQKQLSTTANTVTIADATAIFGLKDDE